MATRIADGWFGDRDEGNMGLYEFRRGLPQLPQWRRKDAMLTHDKPGYACNGTCEGRVRGAGFAYDCWVTTETLDLGSAATDDETVLSVSLWVAQNTTGQPFLRMRTRYLSHVDAAYIATVQAETCYLTAATVEYPVTIQNTTVALRNDHLLDMPTLSTYSSPGDDPDAPKGVPAGPLISLRNFVLPALAENATKSLDPDINRSSYTSLGNLSDIFFVADGDKPDPSPAKCRLKFTRPTEYALRVMYEFMFRFALAAGNPNNGRAAETQTFTAQRMVSRLVFQVDAQFLAVSLVALASGIVLVVALMWNWWLLGRPVTLSPLETAAALGKPILQHQPNAILSEILSEAKRMRRETTWGTSNVEVVTVEIGGEKGDA